MAEVRNIDVKNAMMASAGLQVGFDDIPSVLGKVVSPIIDVTPRMHRITDVINGSSSTATSFNVLTSSSTKDTYITGCSYSIAKDATADIATAASCAVTVVVGGATLPIIKVPVITLTAQNITVTVQFPNPIKVDRNTSVLASRGSTTVGVVVIAATAWGYTVEPN